MEKIQTENSEKQKKGKKRMIEEMLSPCIKAPNAEHARAHDDDEPCDDSRAGNLDNN